MIRLVTFLMIFISLQCYSQSGGPPMLTDDPGTVNPGHFEINTAILSEIGETQQWQVPLIDINYGLIENIQLKLEIPFILSDDLDSKWTTTFGGSSFGIKYRIIEADSDRISVSAYPQISVPLHAEEKIEYKLPVQFQIQRDRLLIGDEIGFLYPSQIFNGFLTGVNLTDKIESMGEIYTIFNCSHFHLENCMINFGLRLHLSETAIFLGSLGTDLYASEKPERKYFFFYTGMQWVL